MEDTLFTPQILATLGGASFLTYLVVAYTKSQVQNLIGLTSDLYAVIIGTIIILLAQLAMGANPSLRSYSTFP